MTRPFAQFAILAAIAAACSSAAAGRLVGQSIKGTQRECRYVMPPAPGDVLPKVEVMVGIGEPCPHRRPREKAAGATDPAVQVPSMAILDREIRLSGRRYCRYLYQGRFYTRALETSRRCPLTPR